MHPFQMKMIFFIFCDALEARRITYHATHGMHATPMARPDEELRIAPHKVLSHANLNSVWQQAIWVSLESFDIAKDVIPSSTVQTNRVIPQLIKDFIHLKDSRKCFNQNSGPDASSLYPCHLLCPLKHIVPYLCFPANTRELISIFHRITLQQCCYSYDISFSFSYSYKSYFPKQRLQMATTTTLIQLSNSGVYV